MHDGRTRYGRTLSSLEPLRYDGGTRATSRFPRLEAQTTRTAEALFLERQRVMWSAVKEERAPGVFIFAAHAQAGLVGRLWLKADDTPRAGVVGRHAEADLALPLDDAMSLRHVLFVVRRERGVVRLRAVDLATPDGLHLDDHTRVAMFEASGPVFARVSDFVFFCFPTGGAPSWDRDADDPLSSLGSRLPQRLERWDARSASATSATVRTSTGALCSLSQFELSRGVLVGRYPRCQVHVEHDWVSRVHGVFLSLDGAPFYFDAASTNGSWVGDVEHRVLALGPDVCIGLGDEHVTWRVVH